MTTSQASRRLMEKVGFECERAIVHAGPPHVLYRITASNGKSTAVNGSASIALLPIGVSQTFSNIQSGLMEDGRPRVLVVDDERQSLISSTGYRLEG